LARREDILWARARAKHFFSLIRVYEGLKIQPQCKDLESKGKPKMDEFNHREPRKLGLGLFRASPVLSTLALSYNYDV